MKSRVHEYGGGALCLVPRSRSQPLSFAYVDRGDQRVRMLACGEATSHDRAGVRPSEPGPLLLGEGAPPGKRWSHGDLTASDDGTLVLAVRESSGPPYEHSIVALDPAVPERSSVLLSSSEFVAAPRLDRTGRRVAWIAWDRSEMPWTSSELWVAELERGPDGPRLAAARAVVSDSGVSVGQPTWTSGGALVFACDVDGWWQPWIWRDAGVPVRACALSAEFHGPDWLLGRSTMVALDDGSIACSWRSAGVDHLGLVRPDRQRLDTIDQPAVAISELCAHGQGVAWLGDTPSESGVLWWLPLRERVRRRVSRAVPGTSAPLDRREISEAEHFSFVNRSGDPVHGFLYRPRLKAMRGADWEPPPLVLRCHGGPTASAEQGLDVVVQLLTTRGFAIGDVDYGGSTGYGRAYRDRLRGEWGRLDVDDCVDAAMHLATSGVVDGGRMAIRGSSAGGLTALLALARSDCFAGAVSWYGVTDLRALAASTHPFESSYNDWLVGRLPAAAQEYDRRSPRRQVENMTGAVLLLQGEEDPVVPLAQAKAMAAELERLGRRCGLLTFAGEGHGFRRFETLVRCFEAELGFYEDLLVRRTTAGP